MARTEQPMLAAKADVESKHPATKVQVYPASITSRADIDRVLAAIGHIDVLVLNAGHMHPPGPALRLCAADLTTDFDINVLGPMNLLNAFTAMPSSGERTVIHTSSAGAYLERPGLAGYNASKLAMSYMIRMIAAENAGKAGTNESIRAFTFHPALAYTPMAANVLGLKEDQLEYDDSESTHRLWNHNRRSRDVTKADQFEQSLCRPTSQSGCAVRKRTSCRAASCGRTGMWMN